MAPQVPLKVLILDLGDVLFDWSPNTTTKIPGRTMRDFMHTQTWIDYESGRLTQAACYASLSDQFSIPQEEISEAFVQARNSLVPNESMVTFIKELKRESSGGLKVCAMSNVSIEDFEVLAQKLDDWSFFDQTFTSGHAGMRKPEPDFYLHVLKGMNVEAENALLIDDKKENIAAAESLGIRGIVFEGDSAAFRELRLIMDSPVQKAWAWLNKNKHHYNTVTDTGISFGDNFADLLVLEATKDRCLVDLEWGEKCSWNFFKGKPVLVPGGYFPDDLDTTSLALMVLQPEHSIVEATLKRMIKCLNADGLFLTYFDSKKPRTDLVVTANILACFSHFGYEFNFDKTLRLIDAELSHDGELQSTRYYLTPDCCLYFYNRLLATIARPRTTAKLETLIRNRVQQRVGQEGTALDLSMRIITCKGLGIDCARDERLLMSLQREDGGWKAGSMYRYGSTGIELRNEGVTTAMALRALTDRHACSSCQACRQGWGRNDRVIHVEATL